MHYKTEANLSALCHEAGVVASERWGHCPNLIESCLYRWQPAARPYRDGRRSREAIYRGAQCPDCEQDIQGPIPCIDCPEGQSAVIAGHKIDSDSPAFTGAYGRWKSDHPRKHNDIARAVKGVWREAARRTKYPAGSHEDRDGIPWPDEHGRVEGGHLDPKMP